MLRILALICATFIVAGCAGRAPQPTQVTRAADTNLDCSAIGAELDANNFEIKRLADEQGLKVAQNVLAGAAGFFTLGIAWAAMDFQGAASKEIVALQTRSRYLIGLGERRGCRDLAPKQKPVKRKKRQSADL